MKIVLYRLMFEYHNETHCRWFFVKMPQSLINTIITYFRFIGNSTTWFTNSIYKILQIFCQLMLPCSCGWNPLEFKSNLVKLPFSINAKFTEFYSLQQFSEREFVVLIVPLTSLISVRQITEENLDSVSLQISFTRFSPFFKQFVSLGVSFVPAYIIICSGAFRKPDLI